MKYNFDEIIDRCDTDSVKYDDLYRNFGIVQGKSRRPGKRHITWPVMNGLRPIGYQRHHIGRHQSSYQ